MAKMSVVIVGGGAAGIVAAISARAQGDLVVLCDKMPRLGKKILASGNGRCNLLNDDLTESFYNAPARELVKSVFRKFGRQDILKFFRGLGLETYSKEGRIFPITNQAASVLKVLELELKRLSVPVQYDFDITNITRHRDLFCVKPKSGKPIECDKLILAPGGKTYPAYGSDGGLYEIIEKMGHDIIEPVPSVVPLVVKDNLCHILQGQRIFAAAKSIVDNRVTCRAEGELLFTKYGLSGTCILDVSEDISLALNRTRKKEVFVSVDMVPFMDHNSLKGEISARIKKDIPREDILAGLVPNKVAAALRELIENRTSDEIAGYLKDRRFKVMGTRGWNEAEFTCGGVDVGQVALGTLESKLVSNLYFAGEVLDVNGKRGGYNLGWAWASGFVAGLNKNGNS